MANIKTVFLFVMLVLALFLAGCTQQTSVEKGVVQLKNLVSVEIKDNQFLPNELTVKKGTEVEWTNLDNTVHTVTSVNAGIDSGKMNSGDRWSYTFSKTGTVNYACYFHPEMKGTITVTE